MLVIEWAVRRFVLWWLQSKLDCFCLLSWNIQAFRWLCSPHLRQSSRCHLNGLECVTWDCWRFTEFRLSFALGRAKKIALFGQPISDRFSPVGNDEFHPAVHCHVFSRVVLFERHRFSKSYSPNFCVADAHSQQSLCDAIGALDRKVKIVGVAAPIVRVTGHKKRTRRGRLSQRGSNNLQNRRSITSNIPPAGVKKYTLFKYDPQDRLICVQRRNVRFFYQILIEAWRAFY